MTTELSYGLTSLILYAGLMVVTIKQIRDYLLSEFDGLLPKQSWGETSFFYNPEGLSPHGAYFFTIKEKDGDNDKASNLNRDGVYRINFGITKQTFLSLFGGVPTRPAKGQTIQGYDFKALNTLTPHPIYGWMRWLAIISPEEEQFEKIKPLIIESYDLAVTRFSKRKR